MTRLTRPTSAKPLLYLVAFWAILTVTLAGWWFIHGLQQIEMLSRLSPTFERRFSSQHRMLVGEGITFISLLLIGGASLFFLLRREARRNDQMKVFFATFTHELKTPLASLRLQAEALQEDLLPESNPLVERLLQDTSRLELQMENALFLSTVRNSDQIHLEPLSLAFIFGRLQSAYPDLKLILKSEASILADRRAAESVFKNLIQNSRVHGGATEFTIDPRPLDGKVAIQISDNGKGFQGNSDAIGKLFHRHTSQSGSGIGLHLVKILLERMQGSLKVVPDSRGFRLEVRFQGATP